MAPPKPIELPSTMRAWVRPTRGPIETHLKLFDTWPTPEPPPADSDEVLVRISSVALEYSVGVLIPILPALPFMPPFIPEFEFAGTVVAAGSRAPSDVREVGTRVMGFQTPVPAVVLDGKGVLCEYVRLRGRCLARMPDNMPGEKGMDDAAGLNGGGCTAIAMVRAAKVKAGDRVLVNGASGSVGSNAVQVARHKGAHVVAVASRRNEELVRSLGAHEFVDYTAHTNLAAHLASKYGSAPFDHVMDCVGIQSLYEGSPGFLKSQGVLINVGAMYGMVAAFWYWFQNSWRPVWLGGTPRRYMMFSTVPQREDSMLLLKMMEDGDLRVCVDSVWEMEDVAKAYERMGSKRARGKVVIKVKRGV